MEAAISETQCEGVQPEKPPDDAEQTQKEPSQETKSPPKGDQELSTDSTKPEKQSEKQPEISNLDESQDEMIQIHDENFLNEGRSFRKSKENEFEGVHTEIDLTMDLETQRLTGMCRVCARSKVKMFPVFGNEKNISEKIHMFLPILVTPDDLLPVTVCARCLSSLEQSQRLVQTCLDADKKLRNLLERKLTESMDVELKSEKEDFDDDYDGVHSIGGDDDEPDRPPTPLSPTRSTTPNQEETIAPKREVISPEPMAMSTPVSRPKPGPKSATIALAAKSNKRPLRNELARLESDLVLSKDPLNDPKTPNILRKRRTRQSDQETLSPTILEKMRSYGIKESSVVMTKVDIPQNTSSAVVTTVSVPITKDKPKNRPGPRRLYRCLYCSETGSDAYKLLLHQMKMHPGNLLKCPHCGFVCGSDQKAKYDAHVLAHAGQRKILPAIPAFVAIASKEAGTLQINGPRQNIDLSPHDDVQLLDDQPQSSGTPKRSGTSKRSGTPKSSSKTKSLLKSPSRSGADGTVAIAPKKPRKAPVKTVTPVVAQIPGNAIMLRIQVGGKPAGDGSPSAPTALVPVTLYQCARCRRNFNTKEAVEKHMCVVVPPNNLIPIAPKPGDVNFPCTTCGKVFPESAQLREHMTTHLQTFKCDLCDASFRSDFHLKQHAKKHNPEKKEFPCPQCPKVYTVKSRLRVHLYTHSDTPRCVCPQCGKVFRTDGGYRNHIKAHENKRAFACSVCGLRFNRRGNMRRHERNCDGKKSLTCKFCTQKFDQKDELLIHRATVHPELEFSAPVPDASTGSKEKRYTCKVCSEGFVRVMDMRKHQLQHTQEELDKVKDVPDGGAYLCDECGKQIHHKHNYKLHKMHHKGKALFTCDQCDRTFTSKFSLNYHHMLHTGDFPFKCTLCNESFRTAVALQVHRYKHTNEKPFRCRHCTQGFFTRHSLRLHQVVHSNERHYVCRVCGSTFKRRKTLHYHSLIHTGEKPYKCRVCDKAFRQKGTCNIHERNHEMASKKAKPIGQVARRTKRRIVDTEEMSMSEDIEDVIIEEEIEEVREGEIEDERAAQIVEMEIAEQEVETQNTVSDEPQLRIWRLSDPKVQYRVKNIEWKNPTTSQVNEAVYVLRGAEGIKEGLQEVCTVQSEVIGGELLSMYPDIQIQDSEIVEGEKAQIEFSTPDGTGRIIH